MANETYERRKAAGLCTRCGERPARSQRTVCEECAEFIARKSKSGAWNIKPRTEYFKAYLAAHPEKVALYKSRKSEYNKRYREKMRYGYEK